MTLDRQHKVVRMKDIANAVGVSRVTVSLVLNNKAADLRISEPVQIAVREAAMRLGYRPNMVARRLQSADRTLFIALATAREAPLAVLSSTYIGADLVSNASPIPIQLTIESFSRGFVKELPGLLAGSRFNGAIINNTAPEDDDYLDSRDFPVPVIVFNRHMQRRSYIAASNRASGRMAAELLMALGRRRLGVLYSSELTQATAERRAGFAEAVEEAGLPTPAPIVGGAFSARAGHDAMHRFLETGQPLDAVFAVGDYMALGAMSCLQHAGRRIPDDIAMVGHDDVDMSAFSAPALTTIHLPLVDMAREATERLIEIIIGELQEPVERTYDTHIVRRESA